MAGTPLTSASPAAAFQTEEVQIAPLRVVTKEIQPFVIKEPERLTGFSIDTWEEISLLTGLPFEFVEVSTVEEQLDALRQGDADVAIAAISMTPQREDEFDFSHPYYIAGLQILARSVPRSTIAALMAFILSIRFLVGLLAILAILVVVGHLVWLVERKVNPDFAHGYVKGIWEGIWWAAATVTTVGYGDKTVKDKRGRMLGILWMFAGLFLIANFTAFVTAEVTATRLETFAQEVDDLRQMSVAAPNGTTSSDFLSELRIPFLGVESIDVAFELLEGGVVDAIVYDAPVLQYYMANFGNDDLTLIGTPFLSEYYGIALPIDSPHKETINKALLEIRANGTHQELMNKWHLSEVN